MEITAINERIIHDLTTNTTVPLILRDYVKNWPLCQWNLEKWCSIFGDREIPFRCMKKDIITDEPCWERRCKVNNMSFKAFMDNVSTSEGNVSSSGQWMYFDYKYLHQWFSSDTELYKNVSWKTFGYPEKGASDSTIWVGSAGSHTPAHQDTYGVNVVTQLFGKKRWILFPPETGGLKPTRVPYEESSVYSELNFFCPTNIEDFKSLTGGRMVELNAGDALLVPRGWWHYVQNMDPINISLNMWLPHETDSSSQVSEALIKILVSQIVKNLPQDTVKLIINPNEDDILDTPLAVLFLQLETVANTYIDNRRKLRRAKRQRTYEEPPAPSEAPEYDLKALLDNKENNIETVPFISGHEIVELISKNINDFISDDETLSDGDLDGATTSLCLTKALIDAFCENNAIDIVKQNLFMRLESL